MNPMIADRNTLQPSPGKPLATTRLASSQPYRSGVFPDLTKRHYQLGNRAGHARWYRSA
jgi:hypothetical protein